LQQAKPLHPIFINSHSGRDCWSFDTSCAFFERALQVYTPKNIFPFTRPNPTMFIYPNLLYFERGLQLQEKHGAVVYHETHRGRILCVSHP
jgi:hypothetical protein